MALPEVQTPKEVVETPEVIVENPQETTQVEEVKAPSKNEILRELSKEYGVNLFDADGLKQFKEFTESQKTDLQKKEEALRAYEEEKAQWQSKQLEYESKLKASEIGIAPDKLEDALRLANNDPNKLAEVVEKYPIFKTRGKVEIGLQDTTGNKPPSNNSEVEAYMAKNPLYAKYYNKK